MNSPQNVQAASPSPEAVQIAQARLRLLGAIKGGGGWYFWIAGLSLVNTLFYIFGSTTTFVMGLGITQIASGFAVAFSEGFAPGSNEAMIIKIIAVLISLAFTTLFAVFGVFARKGKRWAFITGMILYAIDSLIFIWAQDWMSLAFHALALLGLYGGLQAIGKLQKFEKAFSSPMSDQPPTISPL